MTKIDGLIHNAAIVLEDHFGDVTDEGFDSIMANAAPGLESRLSRIVGVC